MEIIKGKTALVTGGAKRIGRQICRALAEEGIQVVFTYRSSRVEAVETLKMLKGKGSQALAVKADLSRIKECDRVISKAQQKFGKIDILVNNASEFPRTPLEQMVGNPKLFLKQFERLVQIQMRAPLYLGMRLGWRMKKNGWGRIINLTDRVTVKGQAYRNWILYLATKYGLYGINQALAEELKPEVTVNAIAPGLTIPPEEFTAGKIREMRERLPLKHEVDPEEIAADVIHLIRSKSKTGSVILTDSGAGVHTY